MRRTLLLAAVGLALSVSSAAQAQSGCEAYAHNRRVTGTVVGALGGAILGSAVAGHHDRGAGALVGGVAGGVVGNQLSRTSCDHHHAYYRHHPAHYAAQPGYSNYATGYGGSCRYVNRPYYDQAGRLIYAPMQVCD